MITLEGITFDETSKSEMFDFFKKYRRYCTIRSFNKNFKHVLSNIDERLFPDEFKEFRFSQKIFHYLQDDFSLEIGICPICGKRCNFISISNGYKHYCSAFCSNKDPNTKKLMKQTRLEKNGGKYLGESELKKRNNTIQNKPDSYKQAIKDKRKNTNIEKYGVENVMQNVSMKQKAFDTIIERYGGLGNSSSELKNKQENTMMKKYGVKHNWQSKDELLNGQKTREELYGDKNYVCTKRFLQYMKSITEERNEKIISTKKKNHTFNTSKIEEEFDKYISSLNKKFIRQYKDDRYPFSCDFYFPDIDLFVELNGLWTHGGKPFEGTDEDIIKINEWKSKNNEYYNNAIETWTIRDVQKRNCAKLNNLNYIEIFSNDINEIIRLLKDVI